MTKIILVHPKCEIIIRLSNCFSIVIDLPTIAISFPLPFAIAFNSEKERQQYGKQYRKRTWTNLQNRYNKIILRSTTIATAKLEERYIYGSNIILADYTYNILYRLIFLVSHKIPRNVMSFHISRYFVSQRNYVNHFQLTDF